MLQRKQTADPLTFQFLFDAFTSLQGGQQCWALWAFLAACPCTLFIDIISLCLLIGQIKMLACLLLY